VSHLQRAGLNTLLQDFNAMKPANWVNWQASSQLLDFIVFMY
jgi:hypothetical protein